MSDNKIMGNFMTQRERKFTNKLFILLLIIIHTNVIGEYIWSRSTANNEGTKYFNSDNINVSNVSDLEIAWKFNTGTIVPKDSIQATPIYSQGILVTTSLDSKIFALRVDDGVKIWEKQLPPASVKRGLTLCEDTIFVPTGGAGIQMYNLFTGNPVFNSKNTNSYGNGFSMLSPVCTASKIFTANYNGVIEAFDRKTGENIWVTSLDLDGVNARIWSGFSYDPSRDVLYLVTSNSSGMYAQYQTKSGGNSVSLVAINANSGNIIWREQEVINDLWDLDMVGSPIITDILIKGKKTRVVIAVSKVGNIIMVDSITGKPVHSKFNIKVPASDDPKQYTSAFQNLYPLPQPFSDTRYRFVQTEYDPLNPNRGDYIKNLLKHANFVPFAPPSINYDVVMYGLHGGAEWPGAAVDEDRKILVIPSNKNPWIIRVEFIDGNPEKTKAAVPQNPIYKSQCASCHGEDLSGYVEGVNTGGRFVPSLIGLEKSTKNRKLDLSLNEFHKIHKYEKIGIIKNENLLDVNSYLREVNNFIRFSNSMIPRDSYSMLLDQHGLPASPPPWGFLTGVDLITGLKLWQVPFGVAIDKITGRKFKGDINFGGAMVTKAGLVIATGTRDSMARIFDVKSGKEIWAKKLPAAGSAPPMGFTHKGCDYFVFLATGGKIQGFDTSSDQLIVYKLKKCGK